MLEIDPNKRHDLTSVMADPWLAPHLYRLPTTLGALPSYAGPRPLSRPTSAENLTRSESFRRAPSSIFATGGSVTRLAKIDLLDGTVSVRRLLRKAFNTHVSFDRN